MQICGNIAISNEPLKVLAIFYWLK